MGLWYVDADVVYESNSNVHISLFTSINPDCACPLVVDGARTRTLFSTVEFVYVQLLSNGISIVDSLYKNKKSNNSGVADAVEEITSLAQDSLEKEIADTSAVLSQSVIDLRSAENASNKDDMVIDLAQSLIQNTKSLKDPQAQTNVLLSQLVVLAQAILQAENTSSGAALATSLSGLATDQIQSV